MDTFDPETFELKYSIADAATDLYIEGDGHFLIKDVARQVDLDPGEIFNYFPNKKAILQFYYASLIFRYEMMVEEIDDFNSYTLSEKFSNFAYTSLDMLREKQAFVKATFEDLIIHSFNKTDFEKEVERIIKRFLENDQHISIASTLVLNDYSYSLLRRKYLELVRSWTNDTSENQELTIELIDKLTGILQEVIYNPILDKSFDLVKFLNANRKAFLHNIPIVKQICSKIEIR